MKYMGSKARFTKDILPIILENRLPNQYFVDLFTGGANVVSLVDGNRIANDKNKHLIEMFKGLQNGNHRPFEISKELYDKVRTEYNNSTNIEFDDFMIGWIGWMGSANGRFFDGGYSGHSVGKRDYISEQIKNTEAQLDKIKDITFIHSDYSKLEIPNNSKIYCDIPYEDTKQYSSSKNFNHNNFWNWAREKSQDGHEVFISEYNAPDDFECIWQMEVTNSMNTTKTYKPIEKLFKYKG